MKICFEPIGIIEEGLPRKTYGERVRQTRYTLKSRIRIYDSFIDGLEGLEGYSHIYIIYYMHQEERTELVVKPWGEEDQPDVGIFATRFPPRPNKIGLTVVELIAVEKPYVIVKGLDAWTGTPVLDIKPYDFYDIVKNPRVPNWFLDRWRKWFKEKGYDEIVPWLGPE